MGQNVLRNVSVFPLSCKEFEYAGPLSLLSQNVSKIVYYRTIEVFFIHTAYLVLEGSYVLLHDNSSGTNTFAQPVWFKRNIFFKVRATNLVPCFFCYAL